MRIFRPEQLCTAPGRAGTLCRSSRAVPSKRQPWSRTNTKQSVKGRAGISAQAAQSLGGAAR